MTARPSAAAARRRARSRRRMNARLRRAAGARSSSADTRSQVPSASQLPGLGVVGEQRLEDRLELVAHVRVLDRHDDLDPVVEVARHQVGAAEQVRRSLAGLEAEEPAVLEEAAEHGAHADVLAQPRRRPGRSVQTRAHDEVDLRAGLRGAVELLDRSSGSVRLLHLDPDPRVLARRRGGGDRRGSARSAASRRLNGATSSLRNALRPAEAGDVVEEVGDVGGDVRVGGEEADVLVDPRRRRVVVAGADVDVAAQPVALAPDDERRLRVDLQVGEAVDDVDARLLERRAPTRCCGARRSAPSARRGRRSACRSRPPRSAPARAPSRRSSGTRSSSARSRAGSRRRGAHERLDARRERVVRVLDEDVALRDLREQVAVRSALRGAAACSGTHGSYFRSGRSSA